NILTDQTKSRIGFKPVLSPNEHYWEVNEFGISGFVDNTINEPTSTFELNNLGFNLEVDYTTDSVLNSIEASDTQFKLLREDTVNNEISSYLRFADDFFEIDIASTSSTNSSNIYIDPASFSFKADNGTFQHLLSLSPSQYGITAT